MSSKSDGGVISTRGTNHNFFRSFLEVWSLYGFYTNHNFFRSFLEVWFFWGVIFYNRI